MTYHSILFGDDEIVELTAERAHKLLCGAYQKKFVDKIFRKGYQFRLTTPYREIWTLTDDGKVLDYIGVVEI